MNRPWSEMFRSLTTVRCDCCDGTFVDEVGLMIIEDAIMTYRAEVRAKQNADAAAWSTAQANVDAAVQKAMS